MVIYSIKEAILGLSSALAAQVKAPIRQPSSLLKELRLNSATLNWRCLSMKRRCFILGLSGLVSTAKVVHAGNFSSEPSSNAAKLIEAAQKQIGVTLSYDPAYTKLKYPGGDVPRERGVCTDVIIRAYRDALRIDLQTLLHEDMARNFAAYPARWGLKKPDQNIDHRRVPNLQVFFQRQNTSLKVSSHAPDYKPGDIITIDLPGHLPHIGLVTHYPNADGSKPLCIHNIGAGTKLEDLLFAYPVTGHYRFKV
jgi:uncharacterized protein